MDAVGVSQYLSDNSGETSDDTGGDDLLRPKIKISKSKTTPVVPPSTVEPGKKGKGKKKKGKINNKRKHPRPAPPPKPPQVVIPGPEGEEGIVPGKGTKTITTLKVSEERAFPINPTNGEYQIFVRPPKETQNLYIECLSIGEDGRAERLELDAFSHNGQPISINGSKAGPITTAEKIPTNFVAKFKRREKMALALIFTEEK